MLWRCVGISLFKHDSKWHTPKFNIPDLSMYPKKIFQLMDCSSFGRAAYLSNRTFYWNCHSSEWIHLNCANKILVVICASYHTGQQILLESSLISKDTPKALDTVLKHWQIITVLQLWLWNADCMGTIKINRKHSGEGWGHWAAPWTHICCQMEYWTMWHWSKITMQLKSRQ